MKWEYLICLLLLWPGSAMSQSSPTPLITNYAGSALSGSTAPDTAFCKGASVIVHGSYFKRANGGESWDTTQVFLGGLGGFQAPVSYLSTNGGGMNDTLVFSLPDIFLADTCLALSIVKSTTIGGNSNSYTVIDTICLRGDYAQVTYPDTLYCVGQPNPLPQITLGPNTTGAFCCPTGAPGFIVLPTGEVPLYPGAIGTNNQFQYQTTHPQCGDTMQFLIDILPTTTSQASYGGLTNVTYCNAGSAGYPEADTANLIPSFGQGHFADPFGGLVVLDSLTGRLDIGNSQAGTHGLFYIPQQPCYDTAVVTVTILAPQTAQLVYPAIPASNLLCQSGATVNPAFLSGAQGGQFWSVPPGLGFGPIGEIIPAQSQVGTYDVFYLPPGNCVDTVAVLSGLVIDSASVVALGFSSLNACLGDTLVLDTLGPGNVSVSSMGSILYVGPPAKVALAGLGLSGGEILDLSFSGLGNCADTASATITVNIPDDPAFSYPASGYCLNDPNPNPTITGLPGGTFRAVTPNTVVSAAGQLDLAASGAGQHQVRYLTSGPCPDSSTVTVFIYAAASAQFSYPASVFCMGEPDPVPTIQGLPGGSFYADTSGLALDSATGEITIAASTPGTYNVTYALSGGCNTSFSQTIQIVPFDSTTSIRFTEGDFCREGSDPRPAIFGDSAGTFFGSAGLVFSNRDFGMVDLSATGPGGPYVITLDLHNRCAADPADTIYILDTDNNAFSYSTTENCEDGAPLEIDMVSVPGGVFTSPSPNVVFTDHLGTIDLAASLPGGPYLIQYQTGGRCPSVGSTSITILPKPRGIELAAFPEGTICQGEQITLQAVATGQVSSYRFGVNGTPKAGAFDLLQSSDFSDGDSVSCVLENSAGCTDTLSRVLEIAPRPHVQVLGCPRKITRTERVRVELGAYVDRTTYNWTALGVGPIKVLTEEGATLPVSPGQETSFELRQQLDNNLGAASIQLMIEASAGDCIGYSDTIEIEVLPSDHPVFVPELMTPNGDGINDTWEVHWLPGIDPNDYILRLYNRGGGLVETLRPIHNHFDGGNLPDGVYWWSLEGPGGEHSLAGGLTLMRGKKNR